jgi:predicted small secreted protein
MKKFALLSVFCFVLTGCGTLGGAVSGAGEDLKKAGSWIQSK